MYNEFTLSFYSFMLGATPIFPLTYYGPPVSVGIMLFQIWFILYICTNIVYIISSCSYVSWIKTTLLYTPLMSFVYWFRVFFLFVVLLCDWICCMIRYQYISISLEVRAFTLIKWDLLPNLSTRVCVLLDF